MEICRYMNDKKECDSKDVNLDYCFNSPEKCRAYRKFRKEDAKEIETISNKILGAVEKIVMELKK